MSNVRVQPDLYRRIKVVAAANQRKVQAQINIMLRQWIAEHDTTEDKAHENND